MNPTNEESIKAVRNLLDYAETTGAANQIIAVFTRMMESTFDIPEACENTRVVIKERIDNGFM